MKTIKLTVAHDIVGRYVSPEATVSEIHSEGVLCSSTELSVDKWETEDFTWN